MLNLSGTSRTLHPNNFKKIWPIGRTKSLCSKASTSRILKFEITSSAKNILTNQRVFINKQNKIWLQLKTKTRLKSKSNA